MKFSKYSSIENASREKTLEQIKLQGFHNNDWIAELKIDGTNFSIVRDKDGVAFAKRSGIIGEGENFFNYQKILPELNRIHDALWNHLTDASVEHLCIRGELFGGYYPHKEVPSVNGVKAIQKRAAYGPDLYYRVFDISVNGQYLRASVKHTLCSFLQIPAVPILAQGKLDDLLELDPIFEDPIAKELGLPEIEKNYAEGYVFKPVEPLYLPNRERVILKHKNPAFDDIHKKKNKKSVKKVNMPPELQNEAVNVSQYITENRLRDVLGKLGNEFTNKSFGKIISTFNADIIDDYRKDSEVFNTLSKDDQKVITRYLNSQASNFLRERFINIIDGKF